MKNICTCLKSQKKLHGHLQSTCYDSSCACIYNQADHWLNQNMKNISKEQERLITKILFTPTKKRERESKESHLSPTAARLQKNSKITNFMRDFMKENCNGGDNANIFASKEGCPDGKAIS